MLFPERVDPVVGVFPLRDRRPPVAEDGGVLGGRPLFAGIARISRTPRGNGSATASGAVVIESRNRPRLWFWLSSLFQPPWFCTRWNVRIVPPGNEIGFSA